MNAPIHRIPLNPSALTISTVVILAVFILVLIAWCKLLINAGIPWERLFVPIYGTYTQFAVAGCGCYFWVLLAAALLFPAVMGCASASSSEDLPAVLMLIYIVLALAIAFLYCLRLARSYGKGTGFGIGLFLLFPLFIVILGFGSSVYEP